MSRSCPICLGNDSEFLFPIVDFGIYRCPNCGGGFAYPRQDSIDPRGIYNSEYFETYHASPMEGPEFAALRYGRIAGMIAPLLKSRFQESNEHPRVLDVGCASGYLLDLFRQAGWDTVGIEMSHLAVEFGQQKLGLRIEEGDFLEIPLREGSFDLITMFHVIEHFPDPRKAVEKAHRLLKTGGVLFVETPNWKSVGAIMMGRRWSHYIPPEHLNYFGPGSLAYLLRVHGFGQIAPSTFLPPIMEGIDSLPSALRVFGRAVYWAANRVGLGPSLQATAVRVGPKGDQGTAGMSE